MSSQGIGLLETNSNIINVSAIWTKNIDPVSDTTVPKDILNSYANYKFVNQSLLSVDSTTNSQSLLNYGGKYVVDNNRNSLLLQNGSYALIPSNNWTEYSNLIISGWIKTSENEITKQDLVSFYQFENNFNDSSGNAYTLTTTATPSFDATNKKYGEYAVNFTATTQFLSNTNINLNRTFTIAFWLRPTGFSTTNYMIITQGNSAATRQELHLVIAPSGTNAYIRFGFYADDLDSPNYAIASINNMWTHLVFVYNQENNRLKQIYKDGILVASGNAAGDTAFATGTFRIGNPVLVSSGFTNLGFQGQMDDLRIYYRALSEDEIKRIAFNSMNNYKILELGDTFFNDTTNLEAWYKFENNWNTSATSIATYNLTNDTTNPVAFDSTYKIKDTYSAYFDNTNDFLSNSSIDLNNRSFSIAFWVRLTGLTNNSTERFIVSQGTSLSTRGTLLMGWRNNFWLFGLWGDDCASSTMDYTTVNNTWVHMVFTFDYISGGNNVFKIFMNGSLIGSRNTTSGTTNFATGTWIIGKSSNSIYPGFTGYLDDFRIYNRIISDEIGILYNTQKTLYFNTIYKFYNNTQNMICWYKFDQDATNMLLDSSGNNYSLTNTGCTFNNIDFKTFNGSIAFTGSSYLQVANSSSYMSVFTPNTITITCWAKIVASTSLQSLASARRWDGGSGFSGWYIYINNSTSGTPNCIAWGFGGNNTWQQINGYNNFSSSTPTWRHLALTLNAPSGTGPASIYVNGAFVASATITNYVVNTFTDRTVKIGTDESVNSYNLSNGSLLDDFRIYNRVLSADEISMLYNNTNTLYNPGYNISLKRRNQLLSFQINDIPVYETSNLLDNTWNHFTWNVVNSTSNLGYVQINNGVKNNYNQLVLSQPVLSQYPPSAMTGMNTTINGITYRACAYDYYDDTYLPYLAFTKNATGGNAWVGQPSNYTPTTGVMKMVGYSFGNDTTFKGGYLGIDMGQKIVMKSYKVTRVNSTWAERLPKTWKIYATNNDGCWNTVGGKYGRTAGFNTGSDMDWVEIDYELNQTTYTDDTIFSLPNNYSGYRYYAININSLRGGASTSDVILIGEWYIYGYPYYTYMNRLGAPTNQGNLYLSDFRLHTNVPTTEFENNIYDKFTLQTLNNAYVLSSNQNVISLSKKELELNRIDYNTSENFSISTWFKTENFGNNDTIFEITNSFLTDTTNLYFWYKFNTDQFLKNCGISGGAYDLISSSGNTLTYQSSDKVYGDASINFTTANGYLLMPVYNFGTYFNNSISISFWLKRKGLNTSGDVIIYNATSIQIQRNSTNNYWSYNLFGNTGNTNGFLNDYTADNTWNNYVWIAERSGSQTKITVYKNGSQVYTNTAGTWTQPNTNFTISSDTATSALIGNLDDLRIYNKVLAVNEINQLYTSINHPFTVAGITPVQIGSTNNYYTVFTSGTYSVTFTRNAVCDVLLIGGGGGGSGNDTAGGAGACIVSIGYTFTPGTYTITVGAGGSGTNTTSGSRGGDSSIGNIFIAKGGGGGGSGGWNNTQDGGLYQDGGCSGGRGNYRITTAVPPVNTNVVNGITTGPVVSTTYGVYGNAGGYRSEDWTVNNWLHNHGASGGGIGTPGGVSTNSAVGAAGNGLYQVQINGQTYNLKQYFSPNSAFGVADPNNANNFYIGGGGSGAGYASSGTITLQGGLGGGGISYDTRNPLAGGNAINNTGSGGGGASSGWGLYGGNGGSGIVIIRYNTVVEQNIVLKKVNTDLSFLINNTTVFNTPFIDNKWNYILWNIANNNDTKGFVQINNGSKNYFNKIAINTNILNGTNEFPPISVAGGQGSVSSGATSTSASKLLSGTFADGTYIASASSVADNSPDYAFNKLPTSDSDTTTNDRWASGATYNSSTGAYTGAISTTYYVTKGAQNTVAYSGEWLQLQMPVSIVLTSYSISTERTISNRGPKNMIVLGSNDGTNWYLLDTETNITGYSGNTAKQFTVSSNTTLYSYYRLCIGANNNNANTAVGEWKLFGYQNMFLTNLGSRANNGNLHLYNYQVVTTQITSQLESELYNAVAQPDTTEYLKYANIQVYSDKINIQNKDYSSNLLLYTQSSDLNNVGGTIIKDYNKTCLLLKNGQETIFPNNNWMAYSNLTVSGWFKSDRTQGGDDIILEMTTGNVPKNNFFNDITNLYFWYKFDSIDFLKNYGLTDKDFDLQPYSGSIIYPQKTDKVFGDASANFVNNSGNLSTNSYNFATNFTSAATFSFWLKRKELNTNWDTIIYSLSGTSTIIQRHTANDYWNISLFGYNPNTNGQLNDYKNDNVWNHYVWIAEKVGTATRHTCYKNGVFVYTSTGGTWSAPNVGFKISTEGSGFSLIGNIDDFRIYNKALSQDEIQILYYNNGFYSQIVNLIAWYKFDGDSKSMLNDSSGNNNLLISNSSTDILYDGVNKKYGTGSLSINATTAFLSNTSINLASKSFSITFWLRLSGLTSTTDNGYIITQGNATGTRTTIHIQWTGTQMQFAFFGNDFFSPTYNYSAMNNNWVHWGFTYNVSNNQRIIYKDGVQVASGTSGGAPVPATGTWRIGLAAVSTGWIAFRGNIDDVRVYDRVITASEAYALYSMNNDIPNNYIVRRIDNTLSFQINNISVYDAPYTNDTWNQFIWNISNSSTHQGFVKINNGSRNYFNEVLPSIPGIFKYPPAALTANTTVLSGYGINSGTYVCSASTSVTTTEQPFRAFNWDNATVASTNWWASAQIYNNSTGAYNGSISTTVSGISYSGEWIQLQMPIAVVLQYYYLYVTSTTVQSWPKNFVLAGSNDGNTWTLLDYETNTTIAVNNSRLFTLTNNTQAFSYYRIIVLTIGAEFYARFLEWELYAYPVYSYINKLGSVNNQGKLYLSDFNILTTQLTPALENKLYSQTQKYKTLGTDEYVINAMKNLNALYYNGSKKIEANANGASVYGTITASGSISSFYSDMRLKDVVSSIDNPLEKIRNISAFKYIPSELAKSLNFLQDTESVHVGVNAQDVQKVLPEVVELAPFDSSNLGTGEIISKTGENYLSLSYESMIPLLIECTKQLKTKLNYAKQKKLSN